MPVRCADCGYENRDSYRFCGMCGVTLRPAVPAPPPDVQQRPEAGAAQPVRITEVEPEPYRPAPVVEESSRDFHYLLEDEAPKGHLKLYLTLALLLLAGGLMAWHWNRDGYPWAAAPSQTSSPASPSSAANPAPQTPNAQNQSPAQPPVSESHPAPTPPEVTPSAAPASPTTAAPAQETAAPSSTADAKSNSPEAASDAKPSDQSAPEPSASDANPDATAPANENSTPDKTTPETKEAATAPSIPPTVAKPKPSLKPSAESTRGLRGDDKLVAEGQKYLYGNGVPENCDLAQRNLKVAADHSDARALTLLGSMYATGHCVSRDLPSAYRWYAKALRQDPSNRRIEQDLEIIWKQMTTGERQIATKSPD